MPVQVEVPVHVEVPVQVEVPILLGVALARRQARTAAALYLVIRVEAIGPNGHEE